MRALARGSRGQSLIETVVILPIVILLLFGIVYFSNVGTIAERTQIGVRYGALVAFAGSASPGPYSAQAIYSSQEAPGSTCGKPPTSVLYHAPPFPAPTSAPYWNPASATSDCQIGTEDLVGAQFLASRYITYGKVSLNATSQKPTFLSDNPFVGQAPIETHGLQGWVHAAWPGAILACTNKTAGVVQEALTANGTASFGGNVLQVLPANWPPTCTQ